MDRLTAHNHATLPVGRRVPGCPRCWALAHKLEAPIEGWGARAKRLEAQTLTAIRAHDFAACTAQRGVCTCFDA